MDDVQRPRDEHEGELDRLGDAREERGEGDRGHQATDGLLRLGLGLLVDRERRGGQGEHHDGEEAGHEGSGRGVALEEAGDVALHRLATGGGVVAEDEPRHGVEDVVQAEGDEQPVGRAVDEAADDRVRGDPLAEVGEDGIEGRVDDREQHGEDEGREPGDDRHEAPAPEEREVGRQGDPVVLLPEERRDESAEDAAEHPVVDQFLVLTRLGRGQDEGRHGIPDTLEDEVADDGREGGRAVGLLRHADGDPDREQQREVGEQGAATGTEDGSDHLPPEAVGSEQVRLAQPQHEGRHGQRGDGQHEAAPELLDRGEVEPLPRGPLCRHVSRRHGGGASWGGWGERLTPSHWRVKRPERTLQA